MKKNNNIIYIILIALIVIISLLTITQLTKEEGKLTKTTYTEIQKKVKNKETFILVISQSTCSHCASYKPKLTQIAKKYQLNIYYIDYDEEKNANEFLKEFKLDGATPITLFFEKGEEKSLLNRLEGDVSKEKIIEKFKKMGFIVTIQHKNR